MMTRGTYKKYLFHHVTVSCIIYDVDFELNQDMAKMNPRSSMSDIKVVISFKVIVANVGLQTHRQM